MTGERRGEHERLPSPGLRRKADSGLKIDVIIPVYKPGRELPELLDRLTEQTIAVNKIILMNTEKKYFEEASVKAYHNVEIHHLSKKEFDHGGTRHNAVQYSEADIFVLMTQDAMPADQYMIEKLTAHLRDGLTGGNSETAARQEAVVAAAYGRQLPGEESCEWEKVSRNFNYPGESRVKTAQDLAAMGIKTFFCSNVCAAYRRDLYDKLGGFVRHTIFNEDMIYAAGAIRAGYGVAYEAEARVLHSHNYTNMQQMRRNFDLGVSQAQHPEIFAAVPSEAEGKKLVREVFRQLKRKGRLYRFPGFCVQCGFRYVGYRLGRNYRRLPESWILALTSNKDYWT